MQSPIERLLMQEYDQLNVMKMERLYMKND